MTTAMSPEQAAHRARLVRIVGGTLGIAFVLFMVWVVFIRERNEAPPASTTRSAASYAQEFGGGPGRYEAVLRLTDCATLGRMFSDGRANFEANAVGQREVWLGQMEVTDDRMIALGCP